MLLVAVFTLFGFRLVQLQGVDQAAYAAEAVANRTDTVAVPSVRGPVLDRNGVTLVSTVDAVDIGVDQTAVRNPAAAALVLAGPLGREPADLQRRLLGEKQFSYLARGVPAEAGAVIKDLNLPGIVVEEAANRQYPADAVAGPLLGFVQRDGVGGSGVEEAFDEELAGQPGSTTFEQDGAGRELPLGQRVVTEPVPGRGIELTIDRDLQWYAERALAAQVKASKAERGSAIVMDPRTGEILAMANAPSYDPAQPGETKSVERLNFAFEQTYEPGSVEKPLTMAALIDAGRVDPDEVFRVPDQAVRDGQEINDHESHPVWKLTPAGIMAQSSNVGTILASERMSSAELREYLVRFGYGREIDLGPVGQTPGQLPPLDEAGDWPDLTHASIAYGQGVSTTLVHLASAFSTIANGGVRVPPSLVAAVVDPDGTRRPLESGDPERVVSEEAAQEVTRMMEAVMGPDGTGASVVVDGYRVAGKTGTAEYAEAGCGYCGEYTASFGGFAPAEDPALVTIVSIHKPKLGRYGGQLAGPVFADIVGYALPRLGIPPSVEAPPDVTVFAR